MDFSEFERFVPLGHSRAFVARNIRGQGPVSISMTDCPTGRRIILLCYLSIAGRSDARSDGPSRLLKQAPGD